MAGGEPITAALLSYGPAGLIIASLITVIGILWGKWNDERDKRIALLEKNVTDRAAESGKYAEVALTTAKALDVANENAKAYSEAVMTLKLLSERKQP